MGEIKFRAWIYGLGKMMPVKEIDFDDFMPSVMVEINSERHEQMFFENTDYPDCELLQYTGLKDKNGKEIYEGDIVIAWSQGYQATGEVKQRIDGLWLMYPAYQHGKQWGLCPNPKGGTTVEIIGNIYENPELLT